MDILAEARWLVDQHGSSQDITAQADAMSVRIWNLHSQKRNLLDLVVRLAAELERATKLRPISEFDPDPDWDNTNTHRRWLFWSKEEGFCIGEARWKNGQWWVQLISANEEHEFEYEKGKWGFRKIEPTHWAHLPPEPLVNPRKSDYLRE